MQGTFIFGGYGKTIKVEPSTHFTNAPFALAGVHIYGRRGEIYGGDSFTDKFKQNWESETDQPQQIRNAGVVTMGRQGIFSGFNFGVLIQGADLIHEVRNRGVIIGGSWLETSKLTSEGLDKAKITTYSNGGGIRILGQRTVPMEEADPETGVLGNTYYESMIECSTLPSTPTKLKGYITLDRDTTIKDVEGTVIVQNGKFVK